MLALTLIHVTLTGVLLLAFVFALIGLRYIRDPFREAKKPCRSSCTVCHARQPVPQRQSSGRTASDA